MEFIKFEKLSMIKIKSNENKKSQEDKFSLENKWKKKKEIDLKIIEMETWYKDLVNLIEKIDSNDADS